MLMSSYHRSQPQRVSAPPGCAMGSVSTSRAVALSARRSDGYQSAKQGGSHAAAAGTLIGQQRTAGAPHAVRF